MAVLLSYHRLVEKDRQHVSYGWKVSIMAVLAVAVASSLVISFSLYSLWESFSMHCFMEANLSFKLSKGSSLLVVGRINASEMDRRIWNDPLRSTGQDGERYIIDEYNSKWSNSDFCEYLTYTPLFHALLGIIWAALFLTHGRGGEGIGNIIVRPWTIVIPSLAFFTICSISAIVCASLTSNGLEKFCQQFDEVHANADCARMISYFSMVEANELVLPDKNYYLVRVFPWIWAGSYICGALILLLRILLVVDFQLIRVVISTVERDLEPEDSRQPTAEVVNEATQVSVEDIDAL